MADKGNGGVGDWPTISENNWYVLAITSAIFTAVAIVSAFVWIFGDGFDGDADVKRAQALAPFGVALFAVVTFCTASWRGSINARQANQSESEGRAKLLQEGAKLLAEVDKPAHVSAGIATLGVLVAGRDKSYAFQSMNLLADFVEDHMRVHHENRHRAEISGVMRTGEQNGLNTGRNIVFDCTNNDPDADQHYDEETQWHYIPGFKRIRYRRGVFSYDPHYILDELRDVMFSYVEIRLWKPVNVDDRFFRCNFEFCGINSVSSIDSLRNHENFEFSFSRCDFSGCKIHVSELLEKNLKKNKNYYVKGNPPILIDGSVDVEWSEILVCEDKKPGPDLAF